MGSTETDLLVRLRGDSNGAYPAVVVVLSNQVYSITRSTTSPCNIISASVLHSYVFNYLTDAQAHGTRIVIRLYPSPGNFADWDQGGSIERRGHNLQGSGGPAGTDYCGDNPTKFRGFDDLADEMNAIYDVNSSNGWNPNLVYFEPANEPNKEWYADIKYPESGGEIILIPYIDDATAWRQMDIYFANTYNAAKARNSNIRVLTPPMSQQLMAEERQDFQNSACDPTQLWVDGSLIDSSGYQNISMTQLALNDGWSWHDYWKPGLEWWQPAYCQGNGAVSGHVFQAFPVTLRDTIAATPKPAIITEADMVAPCGGGSSGRITSTKTNLPMRCRSRCGVSFNKLTEMDKARTLWLGGCSPFPIRIQIRQVSTVAF